MLYHIVIGISYRLYHIVIYPIVQLGSKIVIDYKSIYILGKMELIFGQIPEMDLTCNDSNKFGQFY